MKLKRTTPNLVALCAGLITCSALSLVALPVFSQSQPQPASTISQQVTSFDLPAGALGSALNSAAQQAGVAISFTTDEVAGKTVPGLKGGYFINAVFNHLLAGSGLNVHMTSSGYVVSSDGGGVMVLQPVDVNEGAIRISTESTGSYSTRLLSTATGLGISAEETPQSVTVITSQRLEDQNMRSLDDVVRNAPGVSATEDDTSRSSYSARGFDIKSYQVDGVPITWQSSASHTGESRTDTAIFERVEIVRGATGLMSGAGDPSASINLVRKHADSKVLTGDISVGFGRWDTYSTLADVSSPLSQDGSIRGRVVVRHENGSSFRDGAGNENSLFYGVIDADISEDTLVRIGASYQNNNPNADAWGGLSSWYADGSRTDWSRSKSTGTDWTAWASTSENYFLNIEHTFANNWLAKFNVNHQLNTSNAKLLYLFGAVDKPSGLGLGGFPFKGEFSNRQTSIDLHVKGKFDLFKRQHDLSFGVTNTRQTHTAGSFQQLSLVAPIGNFYLWDGTIPQPVWGDERNEYKDYTVKQTGYYAATRLALSDSLKVILGGRVIDWEQKGINDGAVDFGETGLVVPYAGVLYGLNEMNTLYASYTEIFQPQNAQDRTGGFLDPITGKSYEIGLKSRFFNGALNTTFSLFKIEQDDLAQPDTGFFIVGSSPPTEASIAAQGTESTGYEVEVTGEPIPGWNISLSYTQFNAEDENGKDVNTRFPTKLFKLFNTYQFSGNLNNLTIGGGVNWQNKNYTDTVNPITGQPERLEQEAYGLVNVMARYEVNQNLTAQLNIDNLLDKKYYSQIGFFNQYAYGKPRNVTLNLKYHF